MSFGLVFFLLLVSTKEAEVKMKQDQSDDICSLNDYQLVFGRFGKETHFLCLKITPIGTSTIASHDSALFLDPDTDEEETQEHEVIRGYPLSDFTMAYGYPLEDPSSGSAEGYIGDDNHFYGVLHLGNRSLHADPYGRDEPNKFLGAFDNDHMSVPRRRRENSQLTKLERRYLPYQIEDHPRISGTARARICDLLLLADKEFFEKDANSSLSHVVRRMMHAVAQADIIFRNADFNEDGIPDNIGFSIKYILVLTSNETNRQVFGNLLDSHSIDGREYLMRFARLRRLSEVCLGVAFSGHAFHNRTLGLSFTSLGGGMGGAAGGLCDRRAYGRSFNTLAIAHTTTEDNERVPERIGALTLAHEMGHSFGAHHDDNFPNPECRGHLMGSQSSASENGMYFEFSLCSKRLIASTLNSMSYCFTEETKPYCGNGIVEAGEACDCGLPSRCLFRDPCCTPRAGGALNFEEGTLHKEGCSVAPSAECHPSQGLCCLSNCRYANLTENGIDCTTQNLDCKGCHNLTSLCNCGLGGRCLKDGTCHAAECALLGLRECQCLRSAGGALGESRMCGICCELEGPNQKTKCVGAELAAYNYMERSDLPAGWPGDGYSGPNVTMQLCSSNSCRVVSLRAWGYGAKCVTRGAVGLCTARGVCTRVRPPRYSRDPDTMRVKLRSVESSARRPKDNISIIYLCTTLYFTTKLN